MTSHSTVSKPATSRGRSASVTGSVLLLVQAGDLDDQLHGVQETAGQRHGDEGHSEYRQRRRRGYKPSTLAGRDAANPDRLARAAFALLCLGFVVGFFVYPDVSRTTTPTTRCCGGARCSTSTCPVFEGFRVPTEHPLAIVAGALLSLLGDGGDRALDRCSPSRRFLALVAGVYRLGPDRLHAAGRRDRGAAAADPLRLRLPRRARLHRHPVHGARRLGGRRSRRSARAAARRSSCCWPPRACCAPRRGCSPGLYFLWMSWRGELGASARSGRCGPRSARSAGRRSTSSSPATRCSRCTTRARRPRTSAASARCRRSRARMPYFFSSIVKLPVLLAALAGLGARRSGSRPRRAVVAAGAAADRHRHVRRDRRRRRCR